MKGIALIRLQIGHLDSVCFLMRDDTVSLSLPPSPALYQDTVCLFFPFFPTGLFYELAHVSGGKGCFLITFKEISMVFIFISTEAALQRAQTANVWISQHFTIVSNFDMFMEMTEFT